jgi:hypothetical protein
LHIRADSLEPGSLSLGPAVRLTETERERLEGLCGRGWTVGVVRTVAGADPGLMVIARRHGLEIQLERPIGRCE